MVPQRAQPPFAVDPHTRLLQQDQPVQARWRFASYSSTAAATLTFRDSTSPVSGIEMSASQVRRTSGRNPLPSAPNTNATPPERSVSHIDTASLPSAAP